MLNVKDYIDEIERIHPFFNENISIKCYQENEVEFTIECYINNTRLIAIDILQNTIMWAANPNEWATCIQMDLERILKKLMNRPFEEVLDAYYEQNASMEELNEIAKLWNDTKDFNEWVQAKREELSI